SPDVVHLHWVADGFFRVETLQTVEIPIVWTMHDMWPFTGGCHYSGDCLAFTEVCGRCPMLTSSHRDDLAHAGWIRRERQFGRRSPVFVSPSRWLAKQARRSSLLRASDIRTIANGIDLVRFSPQDRVTMREKLRLPRDKVLVLAGAARLRANLRKGFAHFEAALKILAKMVPAGAVEIVLFGSEEKGESTMEGFRVHHLGVLKGDEASAAAYAAADIFVAPSLEDNLPNTVIEAMAAGTPVVAYDAGGIPEIIDGEENGLLAPVGQPEALGQALARMVNDAAFREHCRRRAREKTERDFDASASAQKYGELYEELLKR
ncbi:MAG TPA: glycosyltransferase, partial [Opitutaceae bacterium]|nr:glycosyltransferase [Opitutaceae bacterium]